MRSAVALLLALAGPAAAQVKAPPPPDKYQVDIRYRIRTSIDERVRQFRAMTEYLKSIGFVSDDRGDENETDPFDPTAENLSGTLPAAAREAVFKDARIRTAIFRPTGAAYPAGTAQVRIGLSSGLDAADQKRFHDQAAAQLARLGLVENVGYDHRGYTVIRGAMPGGTVPRLLTDLRDLPAGWFLPDIPREQLNLPFRSLQPVRWVEVLASAAAEAAPPPAAEPAPAPANARSPKLQPDVPAIGGPTLVELVLAEPLPDGAAEFRGELSRLAPGVTLEGQIGSFAVVRVPGTAELATLTGFPRVLAVRLPRPAVDAAAGATVGDSATVLKSTRIAELHALGYNGAGTRVVVIGTGFETLPNATLIDLTAETNPGIEPAAATGTAGTAIARTVTAAAPGAKLFLVRVDLSAIHQILSVARAAVGDPVPSAAIQTRIDEQIAEAASLDRQREAVSEEYRQAFADLSDTPAAANRRKAAQQAFEKLQAAEQTLRARVVRLAALREKLSGLRGADVVVSTLVWEDGYPPDGLSDLTRYFSERLVRPAGRSAIRQSRLPTLPAWVQAAGPAAGNLWAGALLDLDDNGVLEFAGADSPRVTSTWTRELNFLGTADGKPDLPAGTRLRFALNWREPQDPNLPFSDGPSVVFTLRLLKQVDPAGTTAATDEFVEAGRSSAPAVRLARAANAGVFEQVFDVALPAAGRYAIRVEARPAAAPLLGALKRDVEITPRLTVRSLAGGVRPVFATYTPTAVGVGVPGDSPAAFTVAADGGPTGAGPGAQLRVKPDARVPGAGGSGPAAGYAGGLAAVMAQLGLRPLDLTRSLGLAPGSPLEVPAVWLQTLPPARQESVAPRRGRRSSCRRASTAPAGHPSSAVAEKSVGTRRRTRTPAAAAAPVGRQSSPASSPPRAVRRPRRSGSVFPR